MDGKASTIELRELAKHYGVHDIAKYVLDLPQFPIWTASASKGTHHYGQGGLAFHTLEVVQLCARNNQYFSTVRQDVDEVLLFLSALFHDVGKIWDYIPLDHAYLEWQNAPHKYHIHHITKSGLIWMNAVKETGHFHPSSEDVLHAILAHHGFKEWGSPVTPQTRMAWILHLSDALSARVTDCYTRGQ
jgi:3'-5' exoribonuclease